MENSRQGGEEGDENENGGSMNASGRDGAGRASDEGADHPAHPHEPASGTSPPALKPREKATILDLARYKEGQRVWWVVFRADEQPEFQRAEEWMKMEHPWMLWRRKIVPWSLPMRPPRTHPGDTMAIMMLCAQRPKIEAFRITSVERSVHSGEFLYTGPKDMVMPENLLFPTRKAAQKEIARLAKLFTTWTDSWLAGEEGKDS
jgi:hypothetical protein